MVLMGVVVVHLLGVSTDGLAPWGLAPIDRGPPVQPESCRISLCYCQACIVLDMCLLRRHLADSSLAAPGL